MVCKKNKPKVSPKKGRYRCEACGSVSKKKDQVCEPKKITK